MTILPTRRIHQMQWMTAVTKKTKLQLVPVLFCYCCVINSSIRLAAVTVISTNKPIIQTIMVINCQSGIVMLINIETPTSLPPRHPPRSRDTIT